MVNCASCEREISVNAGVCPHCGHRRYRGYEWKSDIDVFGWPLIHIAAGRDSKTGKLKVAKGIIAIGQFGIGLFTFAQVGIGLFFGFGQVMFGLLTIGQVAIGLYFGLGQVATGMVAIGQVCLGKYILAQVGYGIHAWTTEGKDPAAVEFFTSIWIYLKSIFSFL